VHISSRRLGEFLVERRVLSRDALDELLVREASEGVPVADLVQREGLVSAQDLAAAVASEMQVPFVDLSERSIRPDVWRLLPEDAAREHTAVALEHQGDGVLVALADPGDEKAVASLEAVLGAPVVAAVAVRDDVIALLDDMYGSGAASATRDAVRDLELDDLLDRVVRLGGSDLHLTVGAAPTIRVQGELRAIEGMGPLNGSDVRRLVLSTLTQRQRERFLDTGELSSSHAIPGRGRFRVAAFVQRDSVAAVMRLVPGAIPSADDLGLPEQVVSWTSHHRGLVLVCGQHASGTSTTLATLVDRINRSRPCHILTVERPIEFLHRHRRAIVNQREVGEDTESFESGLRHALRHDPDVLVAGELSDVESLRLALGAAETGHLVMGTLRTTDAVQTIERIVDVFPAEQQQQVRVQLASTLRGIVVQQLVPAIGGGLALATEVLLPTPGVVGCIRSGDSANLAKAIVGGITSGMSTMDQSLAELVSDGVVERDVALDRAVDPSELVYLLSGDR